MWTELLFLCRKARAREVRVWIDAEQQDLQPTIDAWTLLLMREFNRDGQASVYNTFQAYLKSTPGNVLRHLRLAQEDGWALGIKLVRGAYIATERRELIHETIEDTHRAYDGLVRRLLRRAYPGLDGGRPYPEVALVLATHNETSIRRAYALQRSLVEQGRPIVRLEYAQLQGMADEISCGLLQLGARSEEAVEAGRGEMEERIRPRAFKCLAWGNTQECLQFLLRRVKENGDAVSRTKGWVVGFRKEIWRRVKAKLGVVGWLY